MTEIPVVLKNFKSYHDNYYNSIINNLQDDIEKIKFIENFFKNAIESCDFSILVSLKTLKNIVNDNYFKNVIETGDGASMGGKESRIELVKESFNVDTSNLRDKDYPKYGYLSCKDKLVENFCNYSMLSQYGHVIVTLKKENLMERTTMTVGDSLNFGDYYRKLPTYVSNPKISCIRGEARRNDLFFLKLGGSTPRKYYIHYIFNAIKSKKLLPDKPFTLDKTFDENGFEFYELQYHGDIIFDKDVQQIDFYPDSPETEDAYNQLIPLIEKKNVKCNTIVF